MKFVLQQVMPRGKTALAFDATAVALTEAAVTGTVVEGAYLEWADPNANNGDGDERWTHDLARAKKFSTFMEAMACWKTQSAVRPLRPDGRPNRPLTAFSVTVKGVEE